MVAVATLELVADGLTPVGAYAALRAADPGPSFLLESVVGGERWGRFSILGYRPRRDVVIEADGRDPFASLADLCPAGGDTADAVAARFAGAHVGYLAYDLVHFATKVPRWPAHEPLARLVGDATVVVFDALRQTVTIAARDAADVARARDDLRGAVALRALDVPDPAALPEGVETLVDDASFEQRVRRAQEYIRAGDAFQIVLARPFVVDARGTDPFDAYRALRVLSPSPYMYFLDLPARGNAPALQIAGASPETLVRVEGDAISLRPIAGTRRRGRDAADDARLAAELLADPKELAEHVMLIDLARNDVGRVAQTGSVEVPVRMSVEHFSHVMHIVSEVRGRLRPELSTWDIVRAAFPAGTLTGAPKVRAMQIIRELEERPRGVYGGAVGWFGAGRQLDCAIAIRTIVHRDGRFEVTAGAGVVEGSVPALEAMETRNKARAALAAIRAARGV